MKKRFVMALALLAGLSMLLSSFARAADMPVDMDAQLMTVQKQYVLSIQKEIADDRAMLADVSDDDSKDLLTAKISELEDQLKDLSTLE